MPLSAGAAAQALDGRSPDPISDRARRRVMWRLMPFLIVAYLFAYIDRANLGVAKLQMQADLKFTDTIIGFGAGIFFIGYFLLEIPGSLIVECYSARKWFARIMISWGLIAALTSFVADSRQFYVVRFLLGTAEAGFFPGVIVYLSHWFRSDDRAQAKSWFMMTQPLAVAIGTPVSRWILENIHWSGWAGWRWVFVIEGIPPVALGVAALVYLKDRPHEARWLPEDEKRWLIGELNKEEAQKVAAGRVSVRDAFRHKETLLLMAVFFLIVTSNQALLFFLPSITGAMRGASIFGQTLAATLPYLCSILGILVNGHWCRLTGERRWHTAAPILLTACSMTGAILSEGHLAFSILFLCLMGFTFQAFLSPFWTLPSAYLGQSAAAVAIGTINSFGNLGGFAGPYLFGYLKTMTGNFHAGLWAMTACMAIAGLLATRIHNIQTYGKTTT